MVLWSVGAMATAPMFSVPTVSNTAAHELPPLVVFHTPPPPAATYRMLVLVGSMATLLTRPATLPMAQPCMVMGDGPTEAHCAASTAGPAPCLSCSRVA